MKMHLGGIYPRWGNSSDHLLPTPCYITCTDHTSSIHVILTSFLHPSLARVHVLPFSGMELLHMQRCPGYATAHTHPMPDSHHLDLPPHTALWHIRQVQTPRPTL